MYLSQHTVLLLQRITVNCKFSSLLYVEFHSSCMEQKMFCQVALYLSCGFCFRAWLVKSGKVKVKENREFVLFWSVIAIISNRSSLGKILGYYSALVSVTLYWSSVWKKWVTLDAALWKSDPHNSLEIVPKTVLIYSFTHLWDVFLGLKCMYETLKKKIKFTTFFS